MSFDARWLQQHLHDVIPITGVMGVEVIHYDGRSIRLKAPLAPNTNDKATAFGGSLASLLTVAGWGLLHTRLLEIGRPADVVIHKSEFIYYEPVRGDFSAYCDLPAPALWERFLAGLDRRGRARVAMSSWIGGERNAAVTMDGRYVALIDRSDNQEEAT